MKEFSLEDLFRVFWKNKSLMFGSTIISMLLAALVATNMSNIYKSTILSIPNNEPQSGGLAALAGQFGGLASMAGINLGGDNQGALTVALESLKSKKFIQGIIEKYSWKPWIMGVDGWDMESDTLRYDRSVYNEEQLKWVRDVSLPYKQEPSLQEVYEEFMHNNFKVEYNLENGTVELSVRHYSPKIAKIMVDTIFTEINEYLRVRDVAESEKSIVFLKDKINDVELAQMKTVFFELIEQQMQTLMLANIKDEYFFESIEPSLEAEFHVLPNRIFVVILGGFLGLFFAFAYIMCRALFNISKATDKC